MKRLFHRLLSFPLRFKITIPYLLAAILLAGLATFQISRAFRSTLENRLRSQLADALARSAEGVIDIEAQHLTWLRTIVFTQGVPEAVADQNIDSLRALVLPIVANEQIPYVEILDPKGLPFISWHITSQPGFFEEGNTSDFQYWPMVKAVFQQDEQGDKYAALMDPPWDLTFYTSGPIKIQDNRIVGVILIGTPAQDVVRQLRNLSIADVTFYDPIGHPAVSSLGELPDGPLWIDLMDQIKSNPNETPLRTVTASGRGYIETIATLYIRDNPTEWFLGATLPEALMTEIQGPSIWELLAIFVGGVFVLIGVGVLVAQTIAIPVFRLVEAAGEVSKGNFDQQVQVFAGDEIGSLTQGFNQMTLDLKQREFVNEIFGRMVSNEVREAVLHGKISLGGELYPVTVVFTDIRGFTSMSENINAEEVIMVLNEFFAVISSATKKHHGLINRFGGDSALIVFGAPFKRSLSESVQQGIDLALDIFLGVSLLNARRIAAALYPIRFGVGVNAGEAVAGNLGTVDRFEYTIIGDVVNVAARLQGLSRQFPHTPLLITASSLSALPQTNGYHFLPLGPYELKGKDKPVEVCAILDKLPQELELFKGNGPPILAWTSCYLYSTGYSPEIIAATLQTPVEWVTDWLDEARTHGPLVAKILLETFSLTESQANRIRLEAQGEPLAG